MNPPEVDAAMNTFRILVDSREHQTKQAEERYEMFGVPYSRATLSYGDYCGNVDICGNQLYDTSAAISPLCVVERKMNLDELCLCFGSERHRFIREFERAKENNIRMWLLLENSSFKDAYAGRYRSQYKPKSLIASLLAFQARYNCRIVMCDESVSGKLIHDILYYEGREILMGMVDE